MKSQAEWSERLYLGVVLECRHAKYTGKRIVLHIHRMRNFRVSQNIGKLRAALRHDGPVSREQDIVDQRGTDLLMSVHTRILVFRDKLLAETIIGEDAW